MRNMIQNLSRYFNFVNSTLLCMLLDLKKGFDVFSFSSVTSGECLYPLFLSLCRLVGLKGEGVF